MGLYYLSGKEGYKTKQKGARKQFNQWRFTLWENNQIGIQTFILVDLIKFHVYCRNGILWY